MSPKQEGWSTEDELKWIREIAVRQTPAARRPIIEGYIEGARKRKRWAPIDRARVMSAAHLALFSSSEVEYVSESVS